MSFLVEKQAAQVLPPTYAALVAVNCSTTVQVVDLCSVPRQTAGLGGAAGNDPQNQNPIGKYIRITAQGGDVYFTTGANFALLNAIANTVIYTTVNATTGAVTIAGGETDYIPAGSFKDVFITAGVTPQSTSTQGVGGVFKPGGDSPCRYVAVIAASGNPIARIYQSSP